ncbi:MAG: IclR family transcriptional regulator C-terminal domain-containing protein, partial [Pseudomonadota bacterium]
SGPFYMFATYYFAGVGVRHALIMVAGLFAFSAASLWFVFFGQFHFENALVMPIAMLTFLATPPILVLSFARFIVPDSMNLGWLLGVQAFRVGSAFVRSRDVVTIARPYMRRLMEQSGETVNLGISDRGEIVYLAQVECQKMMRAIAGPGGRARMHCSGVGKAILSHMNPEATRKVLHGRELTRETSHTHTSIEALFQDLEISMQRGYAIDDEENAIGLRCVASAIFDEHGEPLGAVSVSGPTARVTDQRVLALGELVNKIANDITAELGGAQRRR